MGGAPYAGWTEVMGEEEGTAEVMGLAEEVAMAITASKP